MDTKITTLEEVATLHVGSILKRIPVGSELLPAGRSGIEAFEIRSFNTANEMIGLVMTRDSVGPHESPGRIGRLFIKSYNLVQEDVWWLCH